MKLYRAVVVGPPLGTDLPDVPRLVTRRPPASAREYASRAGSLPGLPINWPREAPSDAPAPLLPILITFHASSRPQLDEMFCLVRAFAAKLDSEQESLVITARSSRQRRLAHFAAEAEGLLHRTEAKRNVVGRRRRAREAAK